MTKAHFKTNQRVWVESVGVWATVERVVPTWTGGLSEPVRVTYDVGLGRMFHANELAADPRDAPQEVVETWRVGRDYNRWRNRDETTRHPIPGTHPVVFTDQRDWGGWRVPRAEYDRDPARIEAQARIIAAAPKLRALAQALITLVAADAPPPAPNLQAASLTERMAALERELKLRPATSGGLGPSSPRAEREPPPGSPTANFARGRPK